MRFCEGAEAEVNIYDTECYNRSLTSPYPSQATNLNQEATTVSLLELNALMLPVCFLTELKWGREK